MTEHAHKKKRTAVEPVPAVTTIAPTAPVHPDLASGPPVVCAVRGIGPTLEFAIEETQRSRRPLYLLFVREQPALAESDRTRKWQEDAEARQIFEFASNKLAEHPFFLCYAVSDSPADTIVDIAATVGASHLILGAPQRTALVTFLRGNIIRRVSRILPDPIHLLIYA